MLARRLLRNSLLGMMLRVRNRFICNYLPIYYFDCLMRRNDVSKGVAMFCIREINVPTMYIQTVHNFEGPLSFFKRNSGYPLVAGWKVCQAPPSTTMISPLI